MIFEYCIGFIAGKAFVLPVNGKGIIAETSQTVVATDPKISFAILKDTQDGIRLAALRIRSCPEQSVLESRHPLIGAYPKVPVTVFPNGVQTEGIRQTVASSVAPDPA